MATLSSEIVTELTEKRMDPDLDYLLYIYSLCCQIVALGIMLFSVYGSIGHRCLEASFVIGAESTDRMTTMQFVLEMKHDVARVCLIDNKDH